MHKNIQTKCLIICMVIMALACQKSEQNFTYEKLNEVIITDSTSLSVVQLDSLKITPHLLESKPSGEDYTYQWKIYPQITNAAQPAVVLSTERNLKTKISLPPGNYNMQYKVTSTKTGVASFLMYTVVINGAFYEGWLVSNNKDGKAKLSFLRTDDKLFLDPIQTVNNTSYPGHAIGSFAGIDATYSFSLIYFFTDQGVYRLSGNDFFQNGNTTSIFPQGKQFGQNVAYGMNFRGYDQFIINDGSLYMGFGPSFYTSEVLNPFSERLAGDYSLFPAVLPSTSNFTYFYDNKHKRFMQAPYISRKIDPSFGSASASFDLGNVGKTMIAFDYGKQTYSNNELYFIMEDAVGLRYLYSITAAIPGLNQLISNSPDIEQATYFATSSLFKHLYYATENKIYLYDMLAKSSHLVYTYPPGYKIRDIKMLRSTSKRIVVAVNHGAEGEIHYFDLNNFGDFENNTYVKKFDGFGEIVQISYRSR